VVAEEDILGPREDEGTGDWRKLRSVKLYDLLSKYPGDHISKNEMIGACSTYVGEKRCMHGCGGETSGKEETWKT